MSPRAGTDGRRRDKPLVLVTGGSGFLGRWVVEELLSSGHRVRVLARGKSPGLDVARDLDGTPPLAQAFIGASALFHLAGFVSRDPGDGQRMMRVHIDGTRRVLEAAAAAGVRRVVLASTSGTIAVSRKAEVLDERAPYPTEIVSGWPYYLSKIYQEKLALDLGATLGLEVVVVNPTLLLGPGDDRASSTGDVRKFLKREIPAVPDGGVGRLSGPCPADTPSAMNDMAGASLFLNAASSSVGMRTTVIARLATTARHATAKGSCVRLASSPSCSDRAPARRCAWPVIDACVMGRVCPGTTRDGSL